MTQFSTSASHRAMLLPLCSRLLQDAAQVAAATASSVSDHSHSLWNCPVCRGTMHVVERLSPLNSCFARRLSTSTLHELATAASNHPRAPARQSLCVSAGPQCRASLLFSLGRPLQSVRSRAATAAHSRQQQLCKSSRPAQPYTKPIGSREGRLPSSRCI